MENTPGSVPRASGGFSPEDISVKVREVLESYEDDDWFFDVRDGALVYMRWNPETFHCESIHVF